MRTFLLIFTIIISSFFAPQQSGSTITAKVSNVASSDGEVHFALYTEDNFRKEPIEARSSNIDDGEAVVVFENISPGNYAILVFHDKNKNQRLDFHSNGMPAEDYGASNNPMNFGPPRWHDVNFDLKKEPLSLNIRF